MILDLPNVGKVEFADNISPSQFRSQVKSLADAYDFDPEPFMPELRPLTQLRRGVARGVGQLGIALGELLLNADAQKELLAQAQKVDALFDFIDHRMLGLRRLNVALK